MVKEVNYINIREVLSRLLRHPLLQEVNLEQAIQYVLDFIGIFGMVSMYTDKEVEVHIEDYRGKLPCDLISINQVKDIKSNICLRSMTSTFKPDENRELTFKTQGRVIFTSLKTMDILISYKAIPVDEEGLPLLIENSLFVKTLEAYIKKEIFGILFDENKISEKVSNKAERDYAWLAGQLQNEFTIPSMSEMQSLCNMWNTLIPRASDFYNSFNTLGERELIKLH